jgi:hypothetical protein
MTRLRLELLQWYALFGGALAWTAQHVAGYFVSDGACGPARVSAEPIQIALAVAAGVAVAAAEAAALLVFRATGEHGENAPPPYGRLRFFAEAALVGNVLFFLVVVLDGVGTVTHLPCTQS